MRLAWIAAISPGDVLVYIVMPAVGIGFMVIFVLSFFRPFGSKLEGTKQLIKGFGLDLQVSARTLLLLGGLALVLTGVFLQVQQKQVAALNGQINDLRAKLDIAREQVESAGRQVIRGWLVLPKGLNAAATDVRDLQCSYLLVAKPDQWIDAPLTSGYSGSAVRIMLSDIGRDDVIQTIVLKKRGASEVLGSAENFYPLQPVIKLDKPDSEAP
jgi:hypothetical protein